MADKPQTAADFGLRPGMTVEVLTMEDHLAFVGKVDSVLGGAVILRDAKGNDLPRVTYNQELKLRYIKGQDAAVLQGKICGSTDQFWKLDRLKSKFFKEQRAFFRQRINTSVLAKCFRRTSRGVLSKESVPCQVLDVSAGGLLLTSTGSFEVGERLYIAGVRLVPSVDAFNFNCVVRRVGAGHRYGCRFEALSGKEQDNLLRAIFIVQREELRGQKEQGRR